MFYSIGQFICFILSKIFFGLEIIGKQNLPKNNRFIIACNHVSYLDPIIIGVAVIPIKIAFMAREDLFSNFFFSTILRHLEAFPVKRDYGDLSAIKTALKLLKISRPIVLFPEGRRSETGDLLEPKQGLGFLAMKAGVPIVPACIKGTEAVLPKGAKFIRHHKIIVYFGKPIESPIHYKERRQTYQDISNEAMSCIRRLACN